MKKRILSSVLTLAMIFTMLPQTAFKAAAAEPAPKPATTVYVGNMPISVGTPITTYGGTATLTAGEAGAAPTLTLDGVTIPADTNYEFHETKNYSSESYIHYYSTGIYANGNLNIKLVGTNTVAAGDIGAGETPPEATYPNNTSKYTYSLGVYVEGKLTIDGSVSETPVDGAANLSSEVTKGTLTATAGAQEGDPLNLYSSGIISKDSIEITNSIINATSYKSRCNSVGIKTEKNATITDSTINATVGVSDESTGIYIGTTGEITRSIINATGGAVIDTFSGTVKFFL